MSDDRKRGSDRLRRDMELLRNLPATPPPAAPGPGAPTPAVEVAEMWRERYERCSSMLVDAKADVVAEARRAAQAEAERDEARAGLDAVGHALGVCYDHDHGCGGHGPVEEMVRAAKEGCAARGQAIDAEYERDAQEDRAIALYARASAAEASLAAVNEIRNSIVGLQTINWSEHVYPLVAALDAAGLEGLPYPEGRAKFGTMLERTLAAEASLLALREKVRGLADEWEQRGDRAMPGIYHEQLAVRLAEDETYGRCAEALRVLGGDDGTGTGNEGGAR